MSTAIRVTATDPATGKEFAKFVDTWAEADTLQRDLAILGYVEIGARNAV